MRGGALLEDIAVNILAFEQAFPDYPFLHVYFGPQAWRERAASVTPGQAYDRLQELAGQLGGIDDEFPRFRRTYVADLIRSVIAQADLFLHGRNPPSVGHVAASFLGIDLAPPFDLDQEAGALERRLGELGYESLAACQEARAAHRITGFDTARELIADRLAEAKRMALSRLAPLLPCDLDSILAKSSISVERGPPGPPGCYRHDGGYSGTVMIGVDGALLEDFVTGLLFHEAIPGHHLYYMVRRAGLEGGGASSADAVEAIDTFYSPENAVNEGIAMNADMIFGAELPRQITAALLVEKFLHKLFYNAWHQVNVEGRPADFALWRRLAFDIGLPDQDIAREMQYRTEEARYYIPCYPLGIRLVEGMLAEFGDAVLPLLYAQHSAATLDKVAQHLRAS